MRSAGKGAPVDGRGVPDEKDLEKQLERQMGCMAGFLQLFDRHQILAGKRIYAARRLPSSPATGSTSPSERSEVSVASLVKEAPEECPPSPETDILAEATSRPSLPLPVFDFKEGVRSSWKFREAPRLSLDNRDIVNARGKLRPREIRTTPVNKPDGSDAEAEEQDRQRRSPSVVARLMGLETLPEVGGPDKSAELRRCASESRVSKDLSRFLDSSGFQKPPPPPPPEAEESFMSRASPVMAELLFRESKPDRAPRTPVAPLLQRKSFFDARDVFPEPKQSTVLYGEIERRLRIRGIDEPARDLETLKQILEAVQLKGLLRSRSQEHGPVNVRRSLIYDDEYTFRSGSESPIVVMKPAPRLPQKSGSELPPLPSRSGPTRPPPRSRRDRVEMERNVRAVNEMQFRSPKSSPSEAARSPSSPGRRRVVSPVPQRSVQAQRRANGVQSHKTSPKGNVTDPIAARSTRNRRMTADASPKERVYAPAEDDISTVSENSVGGSSQLDFERSRLEYRGGRSLLERCDKLLHSIEAITSVEQVTAAEQQPSPVSVLDTSSFLCDESPPSALTKRSTVFKDQPSEWEGDNYSQAISAIRWKTEEQPDPEDPDFLYVSDIIRASDRHRDMDSNLYATLEKRHQEADTAPLHRRLLFDTVAEIVELLRRVSPWDAFSRAGAAVSGPQLLRGAWAELRRVREHVPADDLNDVTCGAIKKDMAGDRSWESPSWEMSDAVLHIERQVFKDLVVETIGELADISSRCRRVVVPRRKLIF